ncbi:MAG: class I SAM-dependent methyltransferase [Firmicutes bacterium]|nr:class I SAM-dependent methyltransferase [Bacillota bacterium]
MSDHYFTAKPGAEHKPVAFQAELKGRLYRFQSDAGVFSKTEVDPGTRLLIDCLQLRPGEVVLDLGCGYGPIGMVAADMVGPSGQVYMVDVNERAVELARQNLDANGIENAQVLVSDGLTALPEVSFDWVLCNPPIRAGKKVVYQLLTDAYRALKPGGCLLVVIRTKQGAKSLQAYLEELAGSCDTVEREGGFRVLQCCKHPRT